MSQGWIKGAISGINAKTLVFAAVTGILCVALQFFVLLHVAQARSEAGLAELVSSLEKPAARAVLILDAELARDITQGLTSHDFILSARIFEDHKIILGESSSVENLPYNSFENLISGLISTNDIVERPLRLPKSMSEATGLISLSVDQPRAVAAAMEGICLTLVLTFIAVFFLMLLAIRFGKTEIK